MKPMIVPKEKPQITLTPEQKEKNYWDTLKFDSHKWVEYHEGYYECAFCKATQTSMMPINDRRLCKENPHLLDVTPQPQPKPLTHETDISPYQHTAIDYSFLRLQ